MATPKFPSAAERRDLINQLLQAEQDGTALKTGQYFQEYLASIRNLNTLMDQYSVIEEPYGIPKALEAGDKEALLTALAEAGRLGERFLADVQIKNPGLDLTRDVPGIVGNIQQLMSTDYEALSAYDPARARLSFPEIQETARTEIIDFRGKDLSKLGASQNARIPMTVVDATGKRRRGVFTKANYVTTRKDFNAMLDRMGRYYDFPDFRKKHLARYKREYVQKMQAQDPLHHGADFYEDKDVIAEMKKRLREIVPKYRSYLSERNVPIDKTPAKDATDDMVLSHLILAVSRTKDLSTLLKPIGMTPEYLTPEVFQLLQKGLKKNYVRPVGPTLNGLNLRLQENDRLDQRNSAMSAVAALLGVPDIIARSTNMKYLDKQGNPVEGTFTEFSKGLDLMPGKNAHLFKYVNNDPFAPPCKMIPSLADLQILDYICGNVDRHGGNMTYLVDENGNFCGVQGIDNDSSLGLTRLGKDERSQGLFGTGGLQLITEDMADKVKKITPDMLKFALRGRGLKETEIKAACKRLGDLQQALEKDSKQAGKFADVKNAQGKLCIMKREYMSRLDFRELANSRKASLFRDVYTRYRTRVMQSRGRYPYDPKAKLPQEPNLREVSTVDRKYTAGGISDSMSSMDRAIEDKTVGFRVGDLSKFLRSSGKFRDMISAVKKANTAAKQIQKAIGRGMERMSRDAEDPRVQAQREKADTAIKNVRTAVEAYLEKKMTERGADSMEALKTAGKSPYEQARINYALKVLDSVEQYEAINNPENQQVSAEKAEVSGRVAAANARELREAQRNGAQNAGPVAGG